MYAQSHAVHWTQDYDQEEGLYTKISLTRHNALPYVERYEIIATPINSKQFTEFDMKK